MIGSHFASTAVRCWERPNGAHERAFSGVGKFSATSNERKKGEAEHQNLLEQLKRYFCVGILFESTPRVRG